jgi:hypothetical protein
MPEKLTKTAVHRLVTGDTQASVTDTAAPGLELRVRSKASTWAYRYQVQGKTKRLILGSAYELDLDEARRLARRAADARSMKVSVDEDWLRRERNPAGVHSTGKATWTLSQAIDAYLREIAASRKESTVKDYRHHLRHDALKKLQTRHVDDLTDVEISQVLARFQKSNGTGAAANIARRIVLLWNWLSKTHNRENSGVTHGIKIDLPERRSTKPRARWPSPNLVRKALDDALAGNLGAASPVIAAIILTAQRRLVVAAAERDHIEDGVWHIPPTHRKTAETRGDRNAHLIPWPQEVAIAQDGQFAFPASRVRAAGAQLSHVSEFTAAHKLRETYGFSPHDVRRTFSTAIRMPESGLPEGHAKYILDHNEEADTVTRKHYDAWRHWPEKEAAIAAWRRILDSDVDEVEWRKLTGQRSASRRAKG